MGKKQILLAIESSCDETAAAIVQDDFTVISSVVSSQIALHAKWGGVVPGIASRQHVVAMNGVIKEALEKADVTPDMSVSEISDAMKAAMPDTTIDGLTGAGMTWSKTGEVNKDPKAVVIQNGEYVGM